MSWDYMIQFLPTLGIALGALLGGVGYCFKLSFERRRTARVVLYHLLEIRRLAVRQSMVPERLMRELFDRISAECKAEGLPLPEDLMHETLQPLIETVIKAKILGTEEVSDPTEFEKALTALAGDYPVLAHRVRANRRLHEFIRTAMEGTQKVKEAVAGSLKDSPFAGLVDPLYNEIGDDGVGEFLSDLDADIYAVAFQCGYVTRWRAWRWLREARKNRINKVAQEDVDGFMAKLNAFFRSDGFQQVLTQLVAVQQTEKIKEADSGKQS